MITDRTLIHCLDTSWPEWEVVSGFEFLGNQRWGNLRMDESWDSFDDMLKRLQQMKREEGLEGVTAIFLIVCVAAATAYDAGESVS